MHVLYHLNVVQQSSRRSADQSIENSYLFFEIYHVYPALENNIKIFNNVKIITISRKLYLILSDSKTGFYDSVIFNEPLYYSQHLAIIFSSQASAVGSPPFGGLFCNSQGQTFTPSWFSLFFPQVGPGVILERRIMSPEVLCYYPTRSLE